MYVCTCTIHMHSHLARPAELREHTCTLCAMGNRKRPRLRGWPSPLIAFQHSPIKKVRAHGYGRMGVGAWVRLKAGSP